MKSSTGFTLIEMAVVLAIIAVLAAIMTPVVTGYIDQARSARASIDVQSISQAFNLHYRDTSRYPIWDNNTVAGTGTTPSRNCMVSGTSTTLPTGSGGSATWAALPCTNSTNIGLIKSYLNVNSLGLATNSPTGGQVTFRGPYLDGLDANDPWGQPYTVNSIFLATSGGNAGFWAFVVSAGPDGALNTIANQAKTASLTTGGDDILSVIH